MPACAPADLESVKAISFTFDKADRRTDDVGLSPTQGLSDAAAGTAFLPQSAPRRRRCEPENSFSYECLPAPLGPIVRTMIWQEQLSRNNPEKAPEIEDD